MITVKRGDTYPVVYSVNMDLTGSTTRLLAMNRSTKVTLELDHDITDAPEGEVTHTLTGALTVGIYQVELEVTTQDGEIVTFPTSQTGQPQYDTLRVIEDID